MAKRLNRAKRTEESTRRAPGVRPVAPDEGEEVVPLRRSAQAVQRPRLPEHPPFFLAEHPLRWDADLEAGRILPRLEKIPISKGANLVDKHGDTTELEKRLKREGWTLLEPEIVQDSPGGGVSYLKRVQAQEGVSYLARWERALKGSKTILGDAAGYREFLEWLVDEGHVQLPPIHVMETAADAARGRYSRYSRGADRDPEQRRRAEQWQQREEIWRRTIREVEEAAAELGDEGEEVDLSTAAAD